MTETTRYYIRWFTKAGAIATAIAIALSIFSDIPFIDSLILSALGISSLVFMGHLITLDDDSPGGWSNPDESKKMWNESLWELFIKFSVCVVLFALLILIGDFKSWGA